MILGRHTFRRDDADISMGIVNHDQVLYIDESSSAISANPFRVFNVQFPFRVGLRTNLEFAYLARMVTRHNNAFLIIQAEPCASFRW